MQAPAVARHATVHPFLFAALRGILVVQVVVVLAAGGALAVGSGRPPGDEPGPVPSSPGASSPPPSASPSVPPSVAPTRTTSPTSPTPVPTRPPLPVPSVTPGTIAHQPPVCDYLDVPTPHDHLDDWERTLLDTIYHLPSSYAPHDLVDTSAAGLNGGYLVRRIVVGDLRAMAAAARAAGAPIAVVSAYRSYAGQERTFRHWVEVGGYSQALRTSARAGHSEHQLGTTIDVTTEGGAPPWEYRDWARTPTGAWVAEHSWRFGFVVSYPQGAFDRTCYDYEPWHLRYVGRELAGAIRASGLTAREVLWTLQ